MVDVSVISYGKPWNLLVTLKTLLNVSGDSIDKIYYVEEKIQPEDYDFKIIEDNLKYDRLIRFIPKDNIGQYWPDFSRIGTDAEYRNAIRYEYGIQQTDKDYILIIHNDVLFFNDIVGLYLSNIGDCAGIGLIGQCWNCSLYLDKLCDSERFYTNNLSERKIVLSARRYPKLRGSLTISSRGSLPSTECRLNEFVAILDVNKYKKEVIPNGNVIPIGVMVHDTGTEFFKNMHDKGYKFKNMPFNQCAEHGYFSENGNGMDAMHSRAAYLKSEELAKKYFFDKLA